MISVFDKMKRRTFSMPPKRPTPKMSKESNEKVDKSAEVALAAVISYKKQKEIADYITYILPALERHSDWLNNVVVKQKDFRCALLVGAGPNRFELQEILYPCSDEDIKLEVEMHDSEDHDKIAIAALLKLSSSELENLPKYIKKRMMENEFLRDDLHQGKALGINFVVLRPVSDKQYRVVERIVIGSSKIMPPIKKRLRDDKMMIGPPFKKTRKVA